MSLSVLPPRDVELDDDEDSVDDVEDAPVPAASLRAFQPGHRHVPPTSDKPPAAGAGSWWMNRPRDGFTHEAETRAPEMVKTKQATSVPGVGREFS